MGRGPATQGSPIDIVRSLVNPSDPALGVGWTRRSNLEAKVRLRIKRLLRRHRTLIAVGGGGIDTIAERVFQQARALYERWPEVDGELWTRVSETARWIRREPGTTIAPDLLR